MQSLSPECFYYPGFFCPTIKFQLFQSVLFSPLPALYLSDVISINLYQPGAINKSLEFPTEWNEMNVKEIEAVSRHFITNFIDPLQKKAAMFIDIIQYRSTLAGLKKNVTKKLNTEDAVINGYPLIDFLFTENNLSEQPYKSIKLPGLLRKKLIGPESHFDTLTCGEFEDAEIYYLQFKEDPTQEHIARMASILFRPKGVEYLSYNSLKDQYITYDAEKMYRRFLKLQPWQLYTIFIWYSGCRNLLPKIFPNAFENDGKESAPDPLSFTKCIHAAAGPKNGTRDQIRRSLLKAIFFEMEQESIKAKELKKLYEQ